MRASRCWAASMLAMALLCAALAPTTLADEQADEGASTAAAAAEPAAPRRPPVIQLRPQDSWVVEICALAFLAAFLVNLFVGRRRNEQLALAWTTEVGAGRFPMQFVGALCARACSLWVHLMVGHVAGSIHTGGAAAAPQSSRGCQ